MSSPYPTWLEGYAELPYAHPWFDGQPVVRIPVSGPAPYNTLAVVRTIVWLHEAVRLSDGEMHRLRLTYPTALTLANYDPQRSEQQRVIHSSSATVHMMQIGFEHGLLTDDNTDFHFAVDDIVTESTLDASGRWSITLDVAAMCYKVWAAACAEITSWVLCYEPVSHPSSPATIYLPDPEMVKAQVALVEARHNRVARMINEGSIEAAVSRVAETISGYRQYARLPGADVMRAGRDLAELAT